MWLRLFVPCGSDPLLTAFAKLHLILVFLALIVFDVVPGAQNAKVSKKWKPPPLPIASTVTASNGSNA